VHKSIHPVRASRKLPRSVARRKFDLNRCSHGEPHIARRTAAAFALVAALLLTNCNGKERGISPIIQAPAVELASQNQMRILNALAIDYNVSDSGNSRWYEVSTAGFNYVDDECRLYFNELFFLNREKDQLKSGLAALGATAAAVMGVTGATTKSISIVAQAFGLGVVSCTRSRRRPRSDSSRNCK
jgi:hypothetical protein